MRVLIRSVCVLFFGVGAAGAMEMDMAVHHLLDICEARTVEAASAKGDALGWRRMADAETEEWRTNFVAYNGGSVDLVGWRREQAGGTELLSFWIAVGPNGHRACAYSTTEPAGILGALSERLGEPDSLEENDAIDLISAWWTRGDRQYSFAQVGSSVAINIGPNF